MEKLNYQLETKEIIESLNSNEKNGLSNEEVKKRQEKYGLNQLDETKKRPWILRFFDQINDCFNQSIV